MSESPPSDRAERLLARVDEHLATLAAPYARRRFLTRSIAAWELAYARFVSTEGRSEPKADAADFLLTIAGLAARLEAQKDEPIRGLCGLLAEAGAVS